MNLSRKDFLSLCACAGAATLLPACGLFDDKEMRICTQSELQNVPFLIRTFNGKDVFIRKEAEGKLLLMSLVCTHKKCTVKYHTSEKSFICPCHDGTYDENGKVVSGPPPHNLHRFKYELRGEEVWILNEWES